MLIRAHQRTNGLILALSTLPSNGSAAHDGSANDSSAFSGSDHPGANARIDAINDYVSRVHADYHDPAPHDEQRQAWQNAVHNAMRGLDDVLKAQQALAQPLALVGHPEYTGDEIRNATALGFVRLAFSAPQWQPEQDLPRQDDPEMVALADLTLTKIVVAELRLRLAPHVFDADDLRQRIFARPDMPEQYALLNALGFMISKDWADAGEAVMNASHTIGRTRLNDLWGMAAASSGRDTASQNMYVIDCTFSADQAFMKECDDAQKNPSPMIDGWWQEARELPPLPVLPAAQRITDLRHRGGRHSSRKNAVLLPSSLPAVPAKLSEESIARKPPTTDDDIRKAWLKQWMRRLTPIFAALMLGGATAACELRKIDDKNVDSLMHDFQNGTLQMTGSNAAVGNTGWFSSDYVNLNNHRKWVELAKLLIEANTADDLSWYLLGASADGLGYEKAAAQYFTNSLNSSAVICAPGPNYLDSICAGLKLPEDTYKRLQQLTQ